MTGLPGRLRLPRSARVRRRREFLLARDTGERHFTRALVFQVRRNGLGITRLGVTVSKKTLRHATDRNRIRRRLREAFRLLRGSLAPGWDVIAILRRGGVAMRIDEARDALASLAKRLRSMARPAPASSPPPDPPADG